MCDVNFFLMLLSLKLYIVILDCDKSFTPCLFSQIHRYYRSSGHTINSAMEEGVSGASKNKYVRGAVKSGVKAGVSTAFDNK